MSRKFDTEINLEIDDSINAIIDEAPGGNSFIGLRKLRWSDKSPFRLDIRKWYINSEGEEIAGKGVAFITEDGPDNLVKELLKAGYGNTIQTLESLKDRGDFLESVKIIIDDMGVDLDKVEVKPEATLQMFYDPKSII